MKTPNHEAERRAAEAKARWGQTEAYRQYEARPERDREALAAGMDRLMAAFAACKQSGAPADSAPAQRLTEELRAFLTAHAYDCTDEILAGLGRTYVSDPRFRANIDRHGEGTAAFIARAIEIRTGR